MATGVLASKTSITWRSKKSSDGVLLFWGVDEAGFDDLKDHDGKASKERNG
jgi:hypothetical protein